MSHTLAPMISNILHELPALIERTLRHETACQALVAQCSTLAGYVDTAKARIAQEKAAQRLLRAEIATFLRERGQMRSANSLRAMEDSLLLSNVSLAETEVSLISAVDGRYESFDVQESPLLLKSKRNAGRIFSGQSPIAAKRRRLSVSGGGPSSFLP
ncbi:hypothetical protein GY45DRAFT_1367804 [Cubamyces sp. BRFM 1775]|nr:hypothetical protein GY45DRAFT_1367804 [Cubamyces sp. BRFM 1775]